MAPTVTVRLSGGLGNQLFQYAAGRALALRNGASLALDLRPLQRSRSRSFMLDPFAHAGRIADDRTLPPQGGPALWWWRRAGGRRVSFYRERSYAFDPSVLKFSGEVYLDGYFQSERYFADRAADIRGDLRLAGGFGPAALAMSQQIESMPSVALHIRRGDYVSNPKAASVHGTVPLRYYQLAAEHIASRTAEAPTIFVFTDDPAWAAENLSLPFSTVPVSGTDISDQEELVLMSGCRHQIIANSSFSWWGAWLNARPDKMVLAPRPWFADSGRSEGDLIPAGWVRISFA